MASTTDSEGPVPAHRRLAAALRDQILGGRIEPDRPLPAGEELEREYGVGADDVRRAIQVLGDEGLVYTVEGRGTYVSTRAEETGGG